MKRLARRIITSLVVLMASYALTGCTDAPSMTCQEYGEVPVGERGAVLGELLRKHDLEWKNHGNIVGVTTAVSEFCGSMAHRSSQNLDRSIDEAHDWTSDTW